MKLTRVIAASNTLIWAALTVSGLVIVDSAAQQRVIGLPNSGQIQYYVGIPAFMTLVGAAILVWLIGGKPSERPTLMRAARLLIAISLLAAPLYLFFYTGGI